MAGTLALRRSDRKALSEFAKTAVAHEQRLRAQGSADCFNSATTLRSWRTAVGNLLAIYTGAELQFGHDAEVVENFEEWSAEEPHIAASIRPRR